MDGAIRKPRFAKKNQKFVSKLQPIGYRLWWRWNCFRCLNERYHCLWNRRFQSKPETVIRILGYRQKLFLHITIKEREWWEKQFLMANLEMIEIENSPFEYTNFCRGIGIDWLDMHTNYIDHPEDGILFISKKVTPCM